VGAPVDRDALRAPRPLQPYPLVLDDAALAARRLMQRRDALVEQVDDRQRFGDRASPGLLDAACGEQLHRIGGAQSLKRNPQAPLGQQAKDEAGWV